MKKQLCDCKSRCNPFLEPTSSKQCGYSSLLGSVSFWSSYVSFRVYCFATYPLSATWLMHFVFGSSLWKGNLWWYCSSCYCRHYLSSCFSTLQQFLQRPRWFASFCTFWHLSYFTSVFLLAYNFEIGISPRNHSSHSNAFLLFYYLSLFRRYCKYKPNIKKNTLISIRPKGEQYGILPVFVH